MTLHCIATLLSASASNRARPLGWSVNISGPPSAELPAIGAAPLERNAAATVLATSCGVASLASRPVPCSANLLVAPSPLQENDLMMTADAAAVAAAAHGRAAGRETKEMDVVNFYRMATATSDAALPATPSKAAAVAPVADVGPSV